MDMLSWGEIAAYSCLAFCGAMLLLILLEMSFDDAANDVFGDPDDEDWW